VSETLLVNPGPGFNSRVAPDARPNTTQTSVPRDVASVDLVPHPDPIFGFLADARPIYAERTRMIRRLFAPRARVCREVRVRQGCRNPILAPARRSAIVCVQVCTAAGSSHSERIRVVDSSAIPAFSFLKKRALCSRLLRRFRTNSADARASDADRARKPTPARKPFAPPLDLDAPQFPGAVAPAPAFLHRRPTVPRFSATLNPVNTEPLGTIESTQPEWFGDLALSSYAFDVEAIRRDFPILRESSMATAHLLDNGAHAEAQSVVDRLSYFTSMKTPMCTSAHELAARATDAYESAREKTRRFLNAGSPREIVFVRGATEAINLVAQSWDAEHPERR